MSAYYNRKEKHMWSTALQVCLKRRTMSNRFLQDDAQHAVFCTLMTCGADWGACGYLILTVLLKEADQKPLLFALAVSYSSVIRRQIIVYSSPQTILCCAHLMSDSSRQYAAARLSFKASAVGRLHKYCGRRRIPCPKVFGWRIIIRSVCGVLIIK